MTGQVTIKKSNMECYRFRNNSEWATICVHAYETPDMGGGRLRQGGEILIYSSYGSFAYHWSHCGDPFKVFLTKITRDYTLRKFLGNEMEEFDKEGSITAVKRAILSYRWEGSLSKDDARECWDDVPLLDECHSSEGFWVQYSESSALLKFDAEGYEFICQREKPHLEHFWNEIWLPFITHLKVEIEEAIPRCCVCGTKEHLYSDCHMGSKVWRCDSTDCMVF